MPILTIRVEHHFPPCEAESAVLASLQQLKELLMATKAEFTASLDQVTAHVAKVGDETRTLIARIGDLTAAVEAAGNSSPEMDAALEALKAQVAVVDDLVPDQA